MASSTSSRCATTSPSRTARRSPRPIVVKTFQRALDPATKSPVAGASLGGVTSVKQTGPYRFEIRLSHPYAFFLHNLSDGGRLMALSPTALSKEGSSFGRRPVSTGPWMVSNWVTRQPDHAGEEPELPLGTVLYPVRSGHISTSWSSASSSTRRRRPPPSSPASVDELTLPSTAVRRIQAMNKYQIVKFLHQGVVFIEFNVLKAPFNDIRVRQAMNYAINKKPRGADRASAAWV